MKTPRDILQLIKLKKKPGKTFLLGIDGPGGTGKTTLAEKLRALNRNIKIVHMDDFDLATNGKIVGNPREKEIGEDTDWQRVKKEVIVPLRTGKTAVYLPFDREGEQFGKQKRIKPGGVVVVEGVFAIRKELFADYDLTLWLTCRKEVRFDRVIKRDGDKMRDRWEKDWLPMEERYIVEHKPHRYAHFVVNTTELLF